MTGPLSFTTPTRVVRETPVELDGETYIAREPKSSLLMTLGVGARADDYEAAVILGFLDLVFDEDDAARLRDRLDDPDDEFDLDTFNKIIEALQGAWSSRPTGRSSASRKRRPRTGRTSTETVPTEE